MHHSVLATSTSTPAQDTNAGNTDQSASPDATASDPTDYTSYPTRLDAAYERFDLDSALRPTIIKPSANWVKRAQKALLEPPTTTYLGSSDLDKEKNKAFDLLDALTCSGALGISHASLHVVIAARHAFDNSIMDTVIQRNVNPIERVERSVLIMSRYAYGPDISYYMQYDYLSFSFYIALFTTSQLKRCCRRTSCQGCRPTHLCYF